MAHLTPAETVTQEVFSPPPVGHNSQNRIKCIFRAHGDRGYTKLKNSFLQDRRISDDTRGLVARLLSLPEDWEVTVKSIIASGQAGRDKVYRMIREAEKYGYVQSDGRERSDAGTLGKQVYLVSDDPQALINRAAEELYQMEQDYQPASENPDVAGAPQAENPEQEAEKSAKNVALQQVSPRTENPDVVTSPQTAKPEQAEPTLENRTHKKNIEDKTNITTNPPTPPEGGTAPSKKRKSKLEVPDVYSSDFEEFWRIYPLKKGKADASRAWERLKIEQKRRAYKALKVQLPELTALMRSPRGNFCAFPATWINQGRFDDEVMDLTASAKTKPAHMPQGNYSYNGTYTGKCL